MPLFVFFCILSSVFCSLLIRYVIYAPVAQLSAKMNTKKWPMARPRRRQLPGMDSAGIEHMASDQRAAGSSPARRVKRGLETECPPSGHCEVDNGEVSPALWRKRSDQMGGKASRTASDSERRKRVQ